MTSFFLDPGSTWPCGRFWPRSPSPTSFSWVWLGATKVEMKMDLWFAYIFVTPKKIGPVGSSLWPLLDIICYLFGLDYKLFIGIYYGCYIDYPIYHVSVIFGGAAIFIFMVTCDWDGDEARASSNSQDACWHIRRRCRIGLLFGNQSWRWANPFLRFEWKIMYNRFEYHTNRHK